MPFQSRSVTPPILRRLSRNLQQAHRDVLGGNISLQNAQEILARTFGHAHWHEAIKTSETQQASNNPDLAAGIDRMGQIETSSLNLSPYGRDQFARLVYAAGLEDTSMLDRLGEAALAQGEMVWGHGLLTLAKQEVGRRRQMLAEQIGSSDNPDFLMMVEPEMADADQKPARLHEYGPIMDMGSLKFIWNTVGANAVWWTNFDPNTSEGYTFYDRFVAPTSLALGHYAPRLGVLFKAAMHRPQQEAGPSTPCPAKWQTYALNTIQASLKSHLQRVHREQR